MTLLGKSRYRIVTSGLDALTSIEGRRIGAAATSARLVTLSKLIRDVRKVLGHSTLTLDHFSPFSFIIVPPLLKGRGAIHPHRAERLLARSVRAYGPVLRVDVLRVHLRMNDLAGA